MGSGSRGPSGDLVYALGALPTSSLVVRPDPARPDKHAFVESADLAALGDYENSLPATRPHWGRAWP